MKENKKRKNEKKGISLIVLVITIIVIVILAVAVILSIANNNPIENANKAKFQSDVKTMQEELELLKASNYVDNNGANFKNEDGTDIKLSDLTSSAKYEEKFKIFDGELKYNASKLSEKEIEWAKELGVSIFGYVLQNGKDGITIDENGKLEGTYTGAEESIIIPDDVITIDENVFSNVSNFNSVTMSDKVTEIRDSAFYLSSIKTISLSNNLEKIGNQVFGETSLTSITIPNSVTSIGDSAFYKCNSLTSITLPESITSISDSTFYECSSLTSITISENATDVKENAFQNCSNLEVRISEQKARDLFEDIFDPSWEVFSQDSLKSKLGVKTVLFI